VKEKMFQGNQVFFYKLLSRKKARDEMRKETKVRLLFMVLLLVVVSIGATLAYADSSVSAVSGRLGAIYDNKTGNVTVMVAGYAEGKAVTLGPVTLNVAHQAEFSNLKAEDVAKFVCGKDFTLKKVTKSENNGKELVADVLIIKSN
jgi:hypothetical protein